MCSETISPSKEVSKKAKAADVVNSSLGNPSVSSQGSTQQTCL